MCSCSLFVVVSEAVRRAPLCSTWYLHRDKEMTGLVGFDRFSHPPSLSLKKGGNQVAQNRKNQLSVQEQ